MLEMKIVLRAALSAYGVEPAERRRADPPPQHHAEPEARRADGASGAGPGEGAGAGRAGCGRFRRLTVREGRAVGRAESGSAQAHIGGSCRLGPGFRAQIHLTRRFRTDRCPTQPRAAQAEGRPAPSAFGGPTAGRGAVPVQPDRRLAARHLVQRATLGLDPQRPGDQEGDQAAARDA